MSLMMHDQFLIYKIAMFVKIARMQTFANMYDYVHYIKIAIFVKLAAIQKRGTIFVN